MHEVISYLFRQVHVGACVVSAWRCGGTHVRTHLSAARELKSRRSATASCTCEALKAEPLVLDELYTDPRGPGQCQTDPLRPRSVPNRPTEAQVRAKLTH